MRRWALLVLAVWTMSGCGNDAGEDRREDDGSDEGAAPTLPGAKYSQAERAALLKLARQSLERAAAGQDLPEVDATALPASLRLDRGCFVTLNRPDHKQRLRGCIGYIRPRGPLYQAVIANDRNAALRDKRFTPVKSEEVGKIEIEISVLTVPAELEYDSPEDLLAKLRPEVDGVWLVFTPEASATYLPQVWKELPDKEVFLGRLTEKASRELPSWAWRSAKPRVLTYQAEVFGESGH